ncbi:MAG: type II toxin-antitoxin system RelE/ParE family toxin [Firmicutes bacterium]|nr:type II toxin-antitoxin system RelE/ParE family toxin [Bacillota bacterium]
MKIQLSDIAQEEIEAIAVYLAKNFGFSVAHEKMSMLIHDIYMLEDHPFMGRAVEARDKNLRILYSKPNMVLYDVADPTVEILHVVDARTDYARFFSLSNENS